VFEGLLPEPYNTILMTLLYRTAEWHAFAKLRLHTESTLQHLERLTTELGQLMRKFRDTTQSAFVTFELPKEMGARQRRQKSGKGKEKAGAGRTSGRKPKTLNLFTYKWHALGDYVHAIRLFGGTDGFSTQLVSNVCYHISNLFIPCDRQGELAHKIVKRLYGSTNKRRAGKQIAQRYRRLERARLAYDRRQLHNPTQQKATSNIDDQAGGDSDLRYHISPSKNHPLDVFGTIRENRGDPAYHVRCLDLNFLDSQLIDPVAF
jgi:hypothetical protein